MLPYFRVLEGPALPVVEMEGAERIMLGSNNYLGLTGDERVVQGARDALEAYGTGLTGSRLLNGRSAALELGARSPTAADATIGLHHRHQANVARCVRCSAPATTVIAARATLSIPTVLLSRAKCAPSATTARKLERAIDGPPRTGAHARRLRLRLLDEVESRGAVDLHWWSASALA